MDYPVDERTGRRVMPLEDFPVEKRAEFKRISALPKPPRRWRGVAGGQIPSRAHYEWYAERGVDIWGKREEIPDWMRAKVLCRDRGRCGICGNVIGPDDVLHIDHIFPLSRGGATSTDNLQPAHDHCNIAKGAKLERAA